MSHSLQPHGLGHQASLSFTISQSLLKLMFVELMMLSNHLILCHPLLLPPQSFPTSGSFPVSQFFALGGQLGASASASVLPKNIQAWFPLGWTGLISLQSNRLSRVFSSTIIQRYQFFISQPSLWSNSHICMTTSSTIALIIWTFVSKVVSPLSDTLYRFENSGTVFKDEGLASNTHPMPCVGFPVSPPLIPWA